MTTVTITPDTVAALIAEAGYEVDHVDDLLVVKDLDTDLAVTVALEGEVAFLSLACTSIPSEQLTPVLMQRFLDAENGISTSFFQISRRDDGRVAISLNNYAKLQACGHDDFDDLEFCLEALFTDVVAARALFDDA